MELEPESQFQNHQTHVLHLSVSLLPLPSSFSFLLPLSSSFWLSFFPFSLSLFPLSVFLCFFLFPLYHFLSFLFLFPLSLSSLSTLLKGQRDEITSHLSTSPTLTCFLERPLSSVR